MININDETLKNMSQASSNEEMDVIVTELGNKQVSKYWDWCKTADKKDIREYLAMHRNSDSPDSKWATILLTLVK